MKTWPLMHVPICVAPSRRYPQPSRLGNGLTPTGAEHLLDRDELLARAAVAGARRFGRLDPLPVAEGDDVDAARVEQPVEPGPPFLAPAAVPRSAAIFSATS